MSEYVDVAVIGGGPAGHTAALYARRAGRGVCLIVGDQPGGQLTTTSHVENWPGDKSVGGADLMLRMTEQVDDLGVPTIYAKVNGSTTDSNGLHHLALDMDGPVVARTVILATGAQSRWLNAPGEEAFKNRGISGCATCDGYFFKDQDVAVIGGGSAAVEEALFLAEMCRSVHVIHRRDSFRAEQILCDRLALRDNIHVIWNATVSAFEGDTALRRISYTLNDGGTGKVEVTGGFVAIGHDPATAPFKDWVQMDDEGYVTLVGAGTKTSRAGVFAAGDVADKVYRQAVTSAGAGCMAALDADRYLASTAKVLAAAE